MSWLPFIGSPHELDSTKPEGGVGLSAMSLVEYRNSAKPLRSFQIICSALPRAKRYCSSGLSSGRISVCRKCCLLQLHLPLLSPAYQQRHRVGNAATASFDVFFGAAAIVVSSSPSWFNLFSSTDQVVVPSPALRCMVICSQSRLAVCHQQPQHS